MGEAARLLLVYGLACGGLMLLAHRFVRRLSPWAAAVLLLLPLVSTGRAMLSGDFYGALNLSYNTAPLYYQAEDLPQPVEEYKNGVLADQIFQVVPWRKAVRELVKTGHPPLLNRFSRGGDPLLGASQAAPFDPKVWIGFLLPLATAVTFACAFVFFQAALFTFLFLRDLRLDEAASIFGAAVWMTCGFLDFYVTWSMASVVATLPLLLLGLRRLARREAHGAALALLAWLLALAGGHPESVLHVTTLGGVVFLAFLVRSPEPRRAVVVALVTGPVALALSAPILLPFLEVLPQTADFHSRQGQHIEHAVPWAEMASSSLGMLYPHGWGDPWTNQRPNLPRRFNAASGASVGTLALALAFVGLGAWRRGRTLFGLLALLTFLTAVGMPGLADLVGALPLFDMALNSRLVFVTAFALAVLAAFGFDALRRHPSRGRLAVLLVVGLGAAVGGLLRLEAMVEAGHATEGHRQALLWLLAPVAAAVAALLWRSPRVLGGVLLGLFLVSHRAELPRFYEAFDSSLFYPPVAELSDLPRGGEPYRVLGRGYDLVPGQSALFELEDMRGPSVISSRRLARTVKEWCKPLYAWFCRVDSLESPLLDLFNVRYVLVDPAAAPSRWRLVTAGEHINIYENPEVLPRAFVPEAISFVGPGPGVVEKIKTAEDFRALAWIEGDKPAGRRANGRATVSTRGDGPDLLLEVEAEEAAWVVVSQTFWQGWRAVTADGRRLEVRPADHVLLGVEVPAGRHEIRLFYRPRGWVIGWWICGLTVAGLAAAGLWWRRRTPTEPDPSESPSPESPPSESPAIAGRNADGGDARIVPKPPEITIVVPAYNEARRLPATLERMLRHLEDSGQSFEILVVDDGSADATAELAEAYAPRGVEVLRQPVNQGKGAALRRGVEHSRGRSVLVVDADGPVPMDQLVRLQDALEEAPVVIASRVAPGASTTEPRRLRRRAMSWTWNRLLRVSGTVGDLRDTQCGFKLFEGEVARRLFADLLTRGFAYDVEILWLARRHGYAVREVGVRWVDDEESTVRAFRDPWRMIVEVVRFRWRRRGVPSARGEFVASAVDGEQEARS